MFEALKSFFGIGVERAAFQNDGSPFQIIGASTNPPRRGTKELIQIYNDSPWLRAVVHKVARGVADTHWRLYVPRGKTGKAMRCRSVQGANWEVRQRQLFGPRNKEASYDIDSVEEITDHPLLDALMYGNPELLGFNVFQTTQTHIDLTGEGFWIKERNALGVPICFWPVPPDWIYELPTMDRPTYKLRPSVSFNSGHIEIPASEIIYFKDPDPSNPYGRGSGIGRALGDEIEIDEYAAKHIKSFFHNRARPDLIVSGDNISKADSQRLEEQWLNKAQGFWKAYKPMFFSRRVDVKTLSQSFENMQMVELRKQERDAFINVFGIPPEKLGVINESKRSTINAADFFWTKDIIKPRVEMIRNFLQWKLVPDFDDRLIIDYDTPILQDDEFKLAVMKTAPWAFTLNEWRRVASEESIDNGEKHLMPLNNAFIDIAAGDELEAPKPTEPENDEEDEEEDDPEEENEDDAPEDDEEDDKKIIDISGVSRRIAHKIASRR